MSLLLATSKSEQWAYSSQQVKDHEGSAIRECGENLYKLMQRAGESAFRSWQSFNAQQTLVLVGNGNNAGDGYEVAKLIMKADRHVVVCAVNSDKTLNGDAQKARQNWIESGGEVSDFSHELVNDCDVIIDALLGTGLENNVRDSFVEIINAANQSGKPILSIDVPSGINADTGRPQGTAIQATKTITFVGIKQGLTTAAGKQYVGELLFDDLGIAQQFMKLAIPSARIININSFQALASRDISSHKGSHGKLLCIGGNKGTSGAIRLSSEAALRAGAGMVKVYTHETSIVPVSQGRPELMITSHDLESALEWATCVIIGPGLGQDDWAKEAFNKVLQYCNINNLPLVMDADALNLLAKQSSFSELNNCILTPHPAEASRLLGLSTSDIESNRFWHTRQCAINYKATCILKGAGTIIDNSEDAWVCEDGNPALAVGGSGDVLTGVIGALLAQGLSSDEAACYGVTLHAKAGDMASNKDGQRGMLASDLFDYVRALINNK